MDHVKPICMFDISKDKDLKEASSWKIHSLYPCTEIGSPNRGKPPSTSMSLTQWVST